MVESWSSRSHFAPPLTTRVRVGPQTLAPHVSGEADQGSVHCMGVCGMPREEKRLQGERHGAQRGCERQTLQQANYRKTSQFASKGSGEATAGMSLPAQRCRGAVPFASRCVVARKVRCGAASVARRSAVQRCTARCSAVRRDAVRCGVVWIRALRCGSPKLGSLRIAASREPLDDGRRLSARSDETRWRQHAYALFKAPTTHGGAHRLAARKSNGAPSDTIPPSVEKRMALRKSFAEHGILGREERRSGSNKEESVVDSTQEAASVE